MRLRWKGLFGFFLLLLGLGLWLARGSRGGEYTVMLDPGHGGSAPGAVYEEVLEKDLNLTVALQVRELLAGEEDLRVLMTREEDTDVGLKERADLSNHAKADLFVSIHSNALENDNSYQGILTFYHRDNRGGKALAEWMEAALVAETGGVDLGTRAEDFAVIREAKAPACLVEMGFMTCPEELARLRDPAYQTRLARGIANGILAYREQSA